MRFLWSRNCLMFYVCGLYCFVNAVMMLLRLGPYAPPPAPKPWQRERDWVRTTTLPSFVIFVHPATEDRYISLELQKFGVWEKPLHERMLDLMRAVAPSSNATFLDVGSNIGFHALGLAAAGYKVVAVEPLQRNVELLRKSVVANGLEELVTVFPVAVGNVTYRDVCIHASSMNKVPRRREGWMEPKERERERGGEREPERTVLQKVKKCVSAVVIFNLCM